MFETDTVGIFINMATVDIRQAEERTKSKVRGNDDGGLLRKRHNKSENCFRCSEGV